MIEDKSIILDNEHYIMSEVEANEHITQRELSRKLGVSVSTVNVLMNKMIKEGLIKMTQVSQRQVLYMLTPSGMMEKAKKTVSYLKGHYRAINETKEKIKSLLDELNQENDIIYVLMNNDEMSEILSIAIHEYKSKHTRSKIKIINSIVNMDTKDYINPVLLLMAEYEDDLIEYKNNTSFKVINMLYRV